MQVHRDIMDGRYAAPPFAGSRHHSAMAWISRDARVEEGADRGRALVSSTKAPSSRRARESCPMRSSAASATSRRTLSLTAPSSGPNSRIGREAVVRRSILGRQCHVGRNAALDNGVVLGDKSVVTDFSRL